MGIHGTEGALADPCKIRDDHKSICLSVQGVYSFLLNRMVKERRYDGMATDASGLLGDIRWIKLGKNSRTPKCTRALSPSSGEGAETDVGVATAGKR